MVSATSNLNDLPASNVHHPGFATRELVPPPLGQIDRASGYDLDRSRTVNTRLIILFTLCWPVVKPSFALNELFA